jgi:hypothetical protein
MLCRIMRLVHTCDGQQFILCNAWRDIVSAGQCLSAGYGQIDNCVTTAKLAEMEQPR